jgi:large subunit ribosomal protein L28
MAKRCELTDKGVLIGNNVSHSKRKTRRRYLPNLQNVTFHSELLGKISLNVATSTIRSVDHNGGIDPFLLTTKNNKLSDTAIKLKRKLKKAVAEKAAPKAA